MNETKQEIINFELLNHFQNIGMRCLSRKENFSKLDQFMKIVNDFIKIDNIEPINLIKILKPAIIESIKENQDSRIRIQESSIILESRTKTLLKINFDNNSEEITTILISQKDEEINFLIYPKEQTVVKKTKKSFVYKKKFDDFSDKKVVHYFPKTNIKKKEEILIGGYINKIDNHFSYEQKLFKSFLTIRNGEELTFKNEEKGKIIFFGEKNKKLAEFIKDQIEKLEDIEHITPLVEFNFSGGDF